MVNFESTELKKLSLCSYISMAYARELGGEEVTSSGEGGGLKDRGGLI